MSSCKDLSGNVCGGHGTCDASTGMCMCDAGWSTMSDFIDSTTFECGTNLTAIRVLWGVNALAIILVAASGAGIVSARLKNFLDQRKVQTDYTLAKNPGLLATMIMFFFENPTQLVMAIYKMVYPDRTIGFDIVSTIFFFIVKFFFYVTVAIYQPAVLEALLKINRELKSLLAWNRLANWMINLTTILIALLGFITFAVHGNIPAQIAIARAYYYLSAGNMFVNGLLCKFVSIQVARVLDASSSLSSEQGTREKMQKLKVRINDVQNTVFKQGMLQGTLMIIFGSLPILFNKHDYFLPISWIVITILGKKCAFAVSLDKHQGRTLREKFGRKDGNTGGSTTENPSSTTRNAVSVMPGSHVSMKKGAPVSTVMIPASSVSPMEE